MTKKSEDRLPPRYTIYLCAILLITASFGTCPKAIASQLELKPVDEPQVLPFTFRHGLRIEGSRETQREHWAFMSPEYREVDGVFYIQEDWRSRDSGTAFVLCSSREGADTRNQINLPAEYCDDWLSYDADQNGTPDVAILYQWHDTLWLQVNVTGTTDSLRVPIPVDTDVPYKQWDGRGLIGAAADLNHDGRRDLLIIVDTGYALKPRVLMLICGATGKVIWQYHVAGATGDVALLPNPDGRRIIVPVGSKGNTYAINGMDDKHSYVICLDSLGNEQWRKITGGTFNGGKIATFDFQLDSSLDIATQHRRMFVEPNNDSTVDTIYQGLVVVYSIDGFPLDTLAFDRGEKVYCLSDYRPSDESATQLLVTTTANKLLRLDHNLDTLAQAMSGTSIPTVFSGDFTGSGENQILLFPGDGTMLLADKDFNLLAQTESEYAATATTVFTPAGSEGRQSLALMSSDRRTTTSVDLVRNPWFTVFFRKPWLAAAFGAFPVVMIALVIAGAAIRVRRKNRVIAETNYKLEVAMDELQIAQGKIIQAEKDKVVRLVAGGVAHEIRNALYPARVSIDKMLSQTNSTSSSSGGPDRLLGMADRAIERAVRLTRHVSEFLKLEEPTPSRVGPDGQAAEVGACLSRVLGRLEHRAKDLGVVVHTRGESAMVPNMNPDNLETVLQNLVLNALEELGSTPNPEICISWKAPDQYLELSVADNGPGVAAEVADTLFDVFVSTKPTTNTGFGLPFSRRIAEVHGGSLELDHSSDSGARFVLKLPTSALHDTNPDTRANRRGDDEP